MLFLFSFIIIILNIKSKRIYENIFDIQNGIISNISKISFSKIIYGTNDYNYKFESKNIIFKYDKNYTYNHNKTFLLHNPKMTIVFNLSIYENNTNLFDMDSKDIIVSDIVIVNINFESITYFQEYEDFSFNLSYNLNDIKNNIIIYYNKIKEIDLFKYLIYNDINELYNNKTLYEYSKVIILNNILNEMKKNLFYYPECDSLYNFKLLYDYFLNKGFDMYVICEISNYYSGTIAKFNYKEITKENTTIILKNIDIKIIYTESFDYIDVEYEYTKTFVLNWIKLEKNLEIKFPYLSIMDNRNCLLEILKTIIKKASEALNNV